MTLSPHIEPAPTLLSAAIELAGNWGHMLPRSADLVVERMRHSCLDGVRLISDRQPTRMRVDEHTSGPPVVWLHREGSTVANSWQPHAKMLRALVMTTRTQCDAAMAERDTAIAERDRALSQIDRLRHLLRQLGRAHFGKRADSGRKPPAIPG